MKNFEIPLYVVANDEEEYASSEAITRAHHIYTGLEQHEYREEAPELEVLTPQRLFAELDGPSWNERRDQININHHVEQLPKCLDIPLAVAINGDISRARWLIDDLIDQGILHEPSSEHEEFFERADAQTQAFEQVAQAEAEKRRQEVMRDLQRDN
jgi:hypothetical protein